MTKTLLAACALVAGLAATPVFAQSPAQVEGQQTTPGNGAGAPGASTTAGNLNTTVQTTPPATTADPTGPNGAAGQSSSQGAITSNALTGTTAPKQ